MAYNRVRTPKFYIDAVLLARQLGYIETENVQGKFYLNPTKTTNIELAYLSIRINKRHFLNSITHCFILGHQLASDVLKVTAYTRNDDGNSQNLFDLQEVNTNGWSKFTGSANTSNDLNRFEIKIDGDAGDNTPKTSTPIGDISIGWSYEMPHSPDMELTQTFANESLKTQTTKGGHTLSNTGWTQPPKWGVYPQWAVTEDFISYPTRRSWNLKFSYVSDTDLMPSYFNELALTNYGMFIGTAQQGFGVNSSFLARVMPTINLGLPFIFQPDSTIEEYAICRVNSPMSFNQVANNVYDVALDIVEVW